MTLQEFTERTGIKMTAQEYVEVENTYMAIGDDIDKDRFCKIWLDKKELAGIMTSRAIEYKRQKEQAQKREKDVRDDIVGFLLEQGQDYDDEAMTRKAVELVGHAEVIRRKLERGYELCESDKNYIKMNLK
mgnify:CR=1 FL=1